MKHGMTILIALLAAGSMSASLAQSPPGAAASAPPSSVCATCGVVQSIRHVEKKGEGSGVGMIAGGVVGGLLGHQIGSGRGNTAATIAGAGAGAYAGHQVERNVKKKAYYVTTVMLDNGTRRTVTTTARPGVREGDRVRVLSGNRIALLAR